MSTIKDKNWATYQDVKKYSEKAKLRSDNQSFLSLMANDGFAFNINNYIECGDLIFFTYYKNSYAKYLIYDKKNRISHEVKFLMNDFIYPSMSYFWNIICTDEKGVYNCMTGTLGLYVFKDALKKDLVNKELDKYDKLKKMDEDSNPIIFYYERK